MSRQEWSRDYFLGEARAFWELCGTRRFWKMGDDHRDGAVKGLVYCYMHADHGDHLDDDATILQAAILNSTCRAAFVDGSRLAEAKR